MRFLGIPAGALLAACLACAPPPAGRETTLAGVPWPALSTMEPAVAAQLKARRTALETMLGDPAVASPELASAFGDLGRLYHAYNLLLPATACYVNARRLAPEDLRWAYLLGCCHQAAGDLDQAATHLEAARALEPGDVPAALRLAETYLVMGRGVAGELFAQALTQDPASAAAHHGLGRLALQQGEAEVAIDHFEQALRLQPRATRLHLPLAAAYRRAGNLAAAEEQLRQRGEVPVMHPDPLIEELAAEAVGASFLIARGNVALQEGRLRVAVGYFRRAVELDPDDVAARELLGGVLVAAGEPDTAIAELRAALDRQPRSASLYFALGRIQAAKGDDQRALEHFRQAQIFDPGHSDAGFNGANTLARLGRFEEALAAFDKVLAVHPHDHTARIRRASLLLILGRSSEAVKALRQLVAEDPDNPAPRDQLAAALQGRR